MQSLRVLVFLLFALIGTTAPAITSAEPLKVGVILPLTGPASGNTRYGRDGIEYATTRGGVAANLQLITEDYGSETARAVTAYKKLANVDGIHAFLVFGSPAAMALKPLVERDNNVMLAIASAQALTDLDGNSFRLVTSALDETKFIAEHWLAGGTDSVGIVHVADDYGESYLQSLRSALPASTAANLLVADFLPKETDFRATINQLRAKKPEIVVLAAFAQPVGLFLRQARELNFQAKFICPLACYNPDLFVLGQGGEENLIVTTPANPQDRALVEEFRKRFQYDGNFMSWGFYDGLNMLSELAQRCVAEKLPGVCLKEQLRRKEGFLTSRGQLAFDATGEMPFRVIVNRASAGKFIAEDGE